MLLTKVVGNDSSYWWIYFGLVLQNLKQAPKLSYFDGPYLHYLILVVYLNDNGGWGGVYLHYLILVVYLNDDGEWGGVYLHYCIMVVYCKIHYWHNQIIIECR